jgi:hypothetical protein
MIVRFQILMKRFGYECGLLLKTYTRQEKLTIIEEGIFEPSRDKEKEHDPLFSGQDPAFLLSKVPQ